MHLPILQLVNFSIILVVFVFLIKYTYDILFGETYQPPAWEAALKSGNIEKTLLKDLKNYQDKVRFYTLWLQIQRIHKDKIQGDFAELGVYKGHSARLIHHMAPDRLLHLFDTFQGFTSKDLQLESGKAQEYSEKSFSDTSLNKVLAYISGNKDCIQAHPGYFPESTFSLPETNYAFVHMDADLYLPTIEGLKYFYPRLSKGGVIIIHDYNYKWEGLVKAVDEFVVSIPETPILVADLDSSLLIVKNK